MMINASIMRDARYTVKGGDYMEKILQIIPANGWCALYKDDNEMLSDPLICFALIEECDNVRRIVGMCRDDIYIGVADTSSNFAGYSKPSTA